MADADKTEQNNSQHRCGEHQEFMAQCFRFSASIEVAGGRFLAVPGFILCVELVREFWMADKALGVGSIVLLAPAPFLLQLGSDISRGNWDWRPCELWCHTVCVHRAIVWPRRRA